MGNSNRPRIDNEDLKLFHAIARHGFVDICYVYRFYKTHLRRDTVRRRIRQLAKHKFLHEEKMFIPPDYSLDLKEGYVAICLGRDGLNMMRHEGVEVPNNISILTKAAPYRIYHQVQVATVCDSMEQSYEKRQGQFIVDRILNEKEATLKDQENQPDAMVLFKQKNGTAGVVAVFIELERSYARWQRIDSKIEAYHRSIVLGKYNEELKLPILAYRLLFVAETQGQFDTLKGKIKLCKNASKIEILLAKYHQLCELSTGRIYSLPNEEGEPYGLLSKLKKEDDCNV